MGRLGDSPPRRPARAGTAKELSRGSPQCRAVVETPKGRRNKFDYDPHIQAFTLGGLLAEGLSFPFDFGFIPSTVADDGDAVDVMILMDEPAHVGCALDVRIIGVIEAEQTDDEETISNNRLVAVAVHSYNHQHIQSISEVSKAVLRQVEEFFVTYNKSRGKKFRVLGLHGPKRAIKLLQRGIKDYEKKSQLTIGPFQALTSVVLRGRYLPRQNECLMPRWLRK